MATANGNGRALEDTVKGALVGKGFTETSHSDWREAGQPSGKFILTNAPYKSIYGHEKGTRSKTEFLLVDGDRRIRIECKWQQSSGSVDEKFPYLFLNCCLTMEEPEIILILGGAGCRPAARQWLENAAAFGFHGIDPKGRIKVMDLEKFMTWANGSWAHVHAPRQAAKASKKTSNQATA